MNFEKDENKKKEQDGDKTRDNKPFDFDAFLEPEEEIDDRVTDVLDGQDLLREDAFDEFAPEYVPSRRAPDGEHGRHEAPGSRDFAPEDFEKEEPPLDEPYRANPSREEPPERPAVSAFDPSDPRYAAPERPKVVVAQPRKKVYVDPPGGEDYDDPYDSPPPPQRRGMGEGAKWLIAILLAAVIVGALLIALFSGSSDSEDDGEQTPKPTGRLTLVLETAEPDEQPAAPVTEPPAEATATPVPTEPPVTTHTITVTAGSGGSISPSGAVSVEDGGSASFTITPNSGYEISQVLVDGESVSIGSSYSFSNVTKDHTIYAVFQASATPTPSPTPTAPPPAETEAPATEPVTEPEPEQEPEEAEPMEPAE